MNRINKVQESLEKYVSLKRLVYAILILLTVVLLNLTWPVWSSIWGKIKSVLTPFVFGFGIAYLIRPIVVFFERYNIKRGISVPLTFIVIFLGIWWLFSAILPSLYADISSLVDVAIDGFQQIYKMYVENSNNDPSPIVASIFTKVIEFMNDMLGKIPTLPILVSNFFSQMLSIITTTLFSFIIGIYFIMDYERASRGALNFANSISPKLKSALIVINRSVSSYLRTLVVIMGITFVEYGAFYFLVGHNYALVMAIITSISLIVPYVGGIAANTFGFLTALNLSGTQIIFMALGVLILPNIDGYVISPLVYSKRNKIDPLWSLFTFFAASTLFGFVGVLISMPVYFSAREVIALRDNDWVIEEN